MLDEVWSYVHRLVDGSIVVSLEQIAESIRLLADRNSLLAEGAGAATLAAALSDEAPDGTIVCVVSGGNIDASKLAAIFDGKMP